MALLSTGVEVKIGALDISDVVTALPELGKGEAEKVETTTLNSKVRTYINGIKGQADSLAIECQYDKTKYEALIKLEQAGASNNKISIKFKEDELTFTFDASVSMTHVTGGINELRTMTVNLTPATEIKIGFGSASPIAEVK